MINIDHERIVETCKAYEAFGKRASEAWRKSDLGLVVGLVREFNWRKAGIIDESKLPFVTRVRDYLLGSPLERIGLLATVPESGFKFYVAFTGLKFLDARHSNLFSDERNHLAMICTDVQHVGYRILSALNDNTIPPRKLTKFGRSF